VEGRHPVAPPPSGALTKPVPPADRLTPPIALLERHRSPAPRQVRARRRLRQRHLHRRIQGRPMRAHTSRPPCRRSARRMRTTFGLERLALERYQTVPTRKITGRSRLQSGRCSRCANECRGWSEWRAGRPRCSLTSRDRRMRCCGARTSKRRRCGLVTHPYRLRQLSSPQYDRRNSSPPVETIRAGLTNVGHSLNRGGERPWQEIADLLEWLKRSPALPHPPPPTWG
jgi:hypothetical protein